MYKVLKPSEQLIYQNYVTSFMQLQEYKNFDTSDNLLNLYIQQPTVYPSVSSAPHTHIKEIIGTHKYVPPGRQHQANYGNFSNCEN
jgi:hypothetical protein